MHRLETHVDPTSDTYKTYRAHNLALARSFAGELGLPEPASPIVRVEVEDADGAVERLKRAGVSCSARSGSIRFAFHLYNDEEDVALALEALRPAPL